MRPSPILQVLKFRHMRLTTKDVNKGYYKGNRTGAMGEHNKYGGYQIHYQKVRTYVVPEGLSDFKLTPFVSEQVKPSKGTYRKNGDGPRDPVLFLNAWKERNGFD
ncbi:50s ribosomal protein 27 [Colletotrichum kahawae]|uniref:50s ribosomal protein 27 n=1 Tax=Colletotrichum kahawae TaxID=34407 RepID=A0AAE0DAC9_COLKA|nr:50s ribosomal protein 27 [Colletotrichum kahawae]